MNDLVNRATRSVERSMERDMDSRAAQSVFDERGNLRMGATDGMQNVGLGEYLDLTLIPWAPEPDGAEHCQNLARLVEYIGNLGDKYGGLGPFDAHDLKCLHATAMLYCTGKVNGREGYEARSAALAESFFRDGGGLNTYWGKPEVRDETCRLIFRHNDPRAIDSDPRLKVFQDALRYELARLNPNDPAGQSMLMLKREWKPEKFYTGWAQSKDNARSWMVKRGWK
jgi:hypothetical protein